MSRDTNELSGLAAAVVAAVVALVGAALASSPRADAQAPAEGGDAATPEAVVSSLHDVLIEAGAADLDREARFERLAPVIDATHDLPFIAELTIRRRWRDLAVEQRERFVDAFRRLSIMTYATRFAGIGPDAFGIVSTDMESPEQARVLAEIHRTGDEPVSLEYLLRKRREGADGPDEQGWRIVNILADGVSDLALKRAEYQRILASGTIDDLIANVEAQTRNL